MCLFMCVYFSVFCLRSSSHEKKNYSGLATAAFSSGIESMCEELGVATEVGRVGMFVFNGMFSPINLSDHSAY